jgi:hypothetical protein
MNPPSSIYQNNGGAVDVGDGGLVYSVSTQLSSNNAGSSAGTRAGGAVEINSRRACFNASTFQENIDQASRRTIVTF